MAVLVGTPSGRKDRLGLDNRGLSHTAGLEGPTRPDLELIAVGHLRLQNDLVICPIDLIGSGLVGLAPLISGQLIYARLFLDVRAVYIYTGVSQFSRHFQIECIDRGVANPILYYRFLLNRAGLNIQQPMYRSRDLHRLGIDLKLATCCKMLYNATTSRGG